MKGSIEIRETVAGDRQHLIALYREAFPNENLWPLVEQLYADGSANLSFVAIRGGRYAGHILFTHCSVQSCAGPVALLGPLGVTPSLQRQGIGSALIREGFKRLRQTDMRQVLVLGDPAYYSRFGFRPEKQILPPYELPAAWSGAWQSIMLDDDARGLSGLLCPPGAWLSRSLWSS